MSLLSLQSLGRLGLALSVLVALSFVTQDASQVTIRAEKVAEHVHVLFGQGGNIGVSIGDDGVLMIDDQFAPLTEKILASVKKLSDKPVRWVVNTHFHGDHTGGNENLGRAGATIVAHDNVRARLSSEQGSSFSPRPTPPSPDGALPTITFTEEVTFHWNGDEIEVFHVDPAHTDGDAIIHFKKANVLHLGDTFFNGLYPFIDPNSGGHIDGMVRSATRILERIDSDTRLIPGHGPVGGREDLQRFRDMLATVSQRMHALIQAGKSRDEVIAARPTQEFDEAWGKGFLAPERFVGIVYDGMTRKR